MHNFCLIILAKNIIFSDSMRITLLKVHVKLQPHSLMGEGFILLTRGYGFMGGVYHPPFDTLKKCTFAYDMNLKLYR